LLKRNKQENYNTLSENATFLCCWLGLFIQAFFGDRLFYLTLWRLAAFEDFRKKTPKRMWPSAEISPSLHGLRTWSKRQKMRQVF